MEESAIPKNICGDEQPIAVSRQFHLIFVEAHKGYINVLCRTFYKMIIVPHANLGNYALAFVTV